MVTKLVDELRPDEPASADTHNLHGASLPLTVRLLPPSGDGSHGGDARFLGQIARDTAHARRVAHPGAGLASRVGVARPALRAAIALALEEGEQLGVDLVL